jgi:hypothetical protein
MVQDRSIPPPPQVAASVTHTVAKVATENFVTEVPFGRYLVSASFANESDDRKLIEVHRVISFFLPCCAWAQKTRGWCSQLGNVVFGATAKFFARFAKGVALELYGGTETAMRCACLNTQ